MIETIVHFEDGHKEHRKFESLDALVKWAVEHHGQYKGFETLPKKPQERGDAV